MQDFESQLDQIRIRMQQEAEPLSNVEAAQKMNEAGGKIAEQIGIRSIQTMPPLPLVTQKKIEINCMLY